MRRPLIAHSITARVLHELMTGPKDGLTAHELSARLDVLVQSIRNTMARLVRLNFVASRRLPQKCNSDDRVKFTLAENGRLFLSGVDLKALAHPSWMTPPPKQGEDEDDTQPLTVAPNVADVIRFVPNSVWALATMTPRVAR